MSAFTRVCDALCLAPTRRLAHRVSLFAHWALGGLERRQGTEWIFELPGARPSCAHPTGGAAEPALWRWRGRIAKSSSTDATAKPSKRRLTIFATRPTPKTMRG